MSLSFHLSKSLKMRAMAECAERSVMDAVSSSEQRHGLAGVSLRAE